MKKIFLFIFFIHFIFSISIAQTDTVYLKQGGGAWIAMPRADYNASLSGWTDIIASILGIIRNGTESEEFNLKHHFRITRQMPRQYKKINRLYKKGKLLHHQYNAIDMSITNAAIGNNNK